MPNRGVRIGEAKNPGPNEDQIHWTMAIVNPTSLANKHADFAFLQQHYAVNLFACSETTATAGVQKTFGAFLKNRYFNSIWSLPVQPQKIRQDGNPSERGKVGGTAIFSDHKCRAPFEFDIQEPWHFQNRIVQAIVQIGATWIQVFVICGYTSSIRASKEQTNQLFNHAYKKSCELPLPAIFAGDFNMDIRELDLYPYLLERGYDSMQNKFQQMFGIDMPKTCKETNIVDTALVHPQLLTKIVDIKVDKSKCFDTHDPVIVKFRIPRESLFTQKMKLPDSWTSLPLSKQDLDKVVHQALIIDGKCDNLTEWANVVEETVNLAVQSDFQQNPETAVMSKLPKRFRGRCQPRETKKCPIPSVVKKAWSGHFNPSIDTVSISFKKMVRQLRRITSLKIRIQKMQSFPEIWFQTWMDVHHEWKVILHSDFQMKKFAYWISDIPELSPIPVELPTLEWLGDCEQIVRFVVHQQEAVEKKLIKDMAKIRHETDVKIGHKVETFSRVKGKDLPPFHQVLNEIKDIGIVVPLEQPRKWNIFVDQPKRFKEHHHILVNDQNAMVTAIGNYSIYVDFASDITFEHEEVNLNQKIKETDLEQVFQLLTSYWQQFWGRDTEGKADQTIDDEYFATLLASLPHEYKVPIFDDTSTEDWLDAIKTSNANSAPGIDGFTFAELKMIPDILVEKLAQIVSTMPSFPDWMMKAKTVPIPKTELTPTVVQSRPITVLATIYRIWSRVSTTKVLQYLGTVLPADITGMLPGRGALNASYHFQVLLEIAKDLKKNITGITLDLKKCFNLIHRKKVLQLLEAFGIPTKILQKWYLSLRNMTRYWMINKQCSDDFVTYTGCPEGDSWSVICMICIATFWATGIRSVSSHTCASAYADNWSFWSTQDEDHEHTLEHTSRYTKTLGLEIDWNKTWKWTTASIVSREFQDAIAKHVPTGTIDTLNHAWDLGAPVNYKGLAQHVKLQKRFEKIKQRLKRILHSPWTLETKVHIINSAIYSAAFYASELLCIGQSHLDSIRSLVASAIIGDYSHSMNPAFALHCAHRKLVDPHLHVILLAIKSARRFLMSCDLQTKEKFLAIASTPSRLVGQSRGPASAIREYILRLGWVISRNGDIQVGAFHSINLVQAPMKRIAHFAVMSWQETLVTLHSSRFKLYGLLPFSRIDTIQTLHSFNENEKVLLIREIAGAFQTKAQQNKWDVTTQDICPWCGVEKDTRTHRILFCSKFEDIRKKHQSIVQTMIQQESSLPEFPVLHQYQHAEFLTRLHFAFPEAIISSQIIDVICSLSNKPYIYTDGSCLHQNVISARYAAYAIVVDWAQSDLQRENEANRYLETGEIPQTLQVIATARVTGEQNIARAEFYAILLCFEHLRNFTLFTDSTYAASCVKKIEQNIPYTKWIDTADFDLMMRLKNAFQQNCEVKKIKAHTNILEITDPISRYHALGNKLANDQAILTCKTMDPAAVHELQQCFLETMQKKSELKELYRLILDLQVARSLRQQSLQSQDDGEDMEQGNSKHTLWNAMETWHVCSEWHFPTTCSTDALKSSAYGFSFSMAIVDFFSKCQWPLDEQGPNNLTMGWSWTEVILGIVLTFGGWPPVRRSVDNNEILIQPRSHLEAKSLGITLSEVTAQTVWYVKHTAALLDKDIYPNDIQHGKVSSLYLMGNPIWTTGFRRRPMHPLQSRILQILRQWFDTYENLQADDIPEVEQNLVLSEWDQQLYQQKEVSWQPRINKARSMMKTVARKRKLAQ